MGRSCLSVPRPPAASTARGSTIAWIKQRRRSHGWNGCLPVARHLSERLPALADGCENGSKRPQSVFSRSLNVNTPSPGALARGQEG